VPSALLYLDANVFVAAFETCADDAGPAQELLLALSRRKGAAVTSELTLAELIAPIQRPHALSVGERRRLYSNVLEKSLAVDLTPVTRQVLVKTAELRSNIGCKLPDAIHIVTATEAGCAYFVSNDIRIKRLPAGLRQARTDRAGVDELLRAISV
jgi:predicted nucleic acid-binding protein